MTAATPANWHPDPLGRHDLRYWDGSRWTDHVASRGLQGLDPWETPPAAKSTRPAGLVERAAESSDRAGSEQPADSSLRAHAVLVVSQKTKFIGVNTEYTVSDQHGERIGAVTEVGRSRVKNALSAMPSANAARRMNVVDQRGVVVLTLTRPAKVLKSTLIVRAVDGSEIGQIVQKNVGLFGKVRFSLESQGQSLGTMHAENWTAWDFSIQDVGGREIARITKTWAGWAKERFTKSDNYVVEINLPVEEPLHSLVIAASLAVDTALKETNAGGSRYRVR